MSNVALPIAGPRPATQPTPAPAAAATAPTGAHAWEEPEFSFADVLDIINPLQHIPILNRVYRAISGDTIGTAAKIAGGTLFGGPLGLVAALVDNAIEDATGKDVADQILAFLKIEPDNSDPDGADEGTDVAEITGRSGPRDLDIAYDEGGRFGRQIALAENLADEMARNLADNTTGAARPQLAAVESAPAPPPRPQASVAPGAPVRLPSPQVLAANPGLIADAREAGAKTEGWMHLMQAAGENNGSGAPALASATIARAMASYGAAGSNLPIADIARAVTR